MMIIEFELIKIDKKFVLRKGDLLYLHNKESFPLQSEVSLETYYFIADVIEDRIKFICYADGTETEKLYSDLQTGYWYCAILPPFARRNIHQ